jgi:peroxiredoxin
MPVPSLDLPLGTRMPWFRVTDLDGREWTTADADGKAESLIIFLSQHSPYVKRIEKHLGVACARLLGEGVMVLGVSPNDVSAYPSDSPEMLRKQATHAGFTFPYAVDPSQRAAKAFRAACTPEFFLYDHELRLVYHGQYDASRTDNHFEPTGIDVLEAVRATGKREVVSGVQPKSLGCSIKWRTGNEPGYLLAA